MRLNYTTSLLLGTVLTAVALTYALWDVDFEQLLTILSELDYSVLVPFLGLLAVFFWLKAVRWASILQPLGRFKAHQVTPALMIGFAANNVLPARLGEVLRVIVLARRFRKTYSGVFATVGIDRLMDVGAILIIYVFAASVLGELPTAVKIGALAGLACIVAATVILFFILRQFRLTISIWRRLSAPLSHRYRELGEGILENLAHAVTTLKSPQLIILLVLNSLGQWGIMTFNVWLALWAFGTTISLAAASFVMVVTALAVSIPSVPGYVGPIQAAFVFALAPFGIASETAFAGSVLFLVAQWVPITITGGFFFIFSGIGVAEVRKDSEREEIARRSKTYGHTS